MGEISVALKAQTGHRAGNTVSIPGFGVDAVLCATSAESQDSSLSLVSLPWGCWDLLFLLHSCARNARALPGQL